MVDWKFIKKDLKNIDDETANRVINTCRLDSRYIDELCVVMALWHCDPYTRWVDEIVEMANKFQTYQNLYNDAKNVSRQINRLGGN
tara:strand:- start:493 stop:750 length:258 start_codon:yes stop_codon:yes gene_type:complete